MERRNTAGTEFGLLVNKEYWLQNQWKTISKQKSDPFQTFMLVPIKT